MFADGRRKRSILPELPVLGVTKKASSQPRALCGGSVFGRRIAVVVIGSVL